MVVPKTPSRKPRPDNARRSERAGTTSRVGALCSGEEELRPDLCWEGRWGRWKEDAVCIVAPCVAELAVDLLVNTSGNAVALAEVISEISSQLSAVLLEGDSLLCISEALPMTGTIKARRFLNAALICKESQCRVLRSDWQGRSLCGSRATVTWLKTTDTTSSCHIQQVRARCVAIPEADSVSLVLPARWCLKQFPDGNSATLNPDSHWYKFATIFGDVACVELAWRSRSDSTVKLIVQFQAYGKAQLMFEILACRYLHNPLTAHRYDACASVCRIGTLAELRARVNALGVPGSAEANVGVSRVAGGGPVYQLRRLNGDVHEQSSEIHLSPCRPCIILGRDADCDLVVSSQHVSRKHAFFRLSSATGPNDPSRLFIEDKSTNGTWVNEGRVLTGSLVTLHDGDRVSFEAAGLPDVPVYGVTLLVEEGNASSTVTDKISGGDCFGALAAVPDTPTSRRRLGSTPVSVTEKFHCVATKKPWSSGSRVPTCPELVPTRVGGEADEAKRRRLYSQ